MSEKAWGKNPHHFKQSNDYNCPDCDTYIFSGAGSNPWPERLVGFHPDSITLTRRSKVVGVMVVECIECFTPCWFHVTQENVDIAKEFCPRWPKSQEPI